MSEPRHRAERLRHARERIGMTPEQLDDLAGLERGSVERFELTHALLPGTVLHDLAAALRIPPGELLEGV